MSHGKRYPRCNGRVQTRRGVWSDFRLLWLPRSQPAEVQKQGASARGVCPLPRAYFLWSVWPLFCLFLPSFPSQQCCWDGHEVRVHSQGPNRCHSWAALYGESLLLLEILAQLLDSSCSSSEASYVYGTLTFLQGVHHHYLILPREVKTSGFFFFFTLTW